MRMNVPLMPIAITVERRPLHALQFRIRDALILVALVAIVLFASQLGPRSQAYRGRAAAYRYKAGADRYLIESSEKSLALLETQSKTTRSKTRQEAADLASRVALFRDAVTHWTRRAEYHSRMSDKYEFAARYPWIPLLSDPPEP